MKDYTKPVFPEARTAVVSGCGAPRGIARAVARRLASEGWNDRRRRPQPGCQGLRGGAGRSPP